MLPNIFTEKVSTELISRIEALKADSQAKWGKMSVAQMLAHSNVTYEMIYEDKHAAPNFFIKIILKLFVKSIVTNEVPYKQNSDTAPQFVIVEEKNFETEKNRLISYIQKTQALGENNFDNKESLSFGVLSKTQWNNMLYKHLNHHLAQFGV